MGVAHNYYDDYQNQYLVNRIADRCYIPMNNLLLELIKKHGKKFSVSLSISGVALDQFEWYAPHVLDSFKKLAKTGQVEFIAETYYHSLASLSNSKEFEKQVKKHSERIEKLFGKKPTAFRNTELIYSDEIGARVSKLGFNTILTEGAKHVLGWKSPNYVYCNAINPKLNVLLRNYQLSDDIAFRFSDQQWTKWPLTTEKYVDWILQLGKKEDVVNIFLDYETFGEHQPKETGIFDFFRALPDEVFKRTNFKFSTPSEISKTLQPTAPVHVPFPISWTDEERDLTAWLGNELQNEAFSKLYELIEKVDASKDPELKKDFGFLQTSDNLHYMCTKCIANADVHKCFSHYASPYDAFINYMNILSDFIIRLENNEPKMKQKEKVSVKGDQNKTVKKLNLLTKKTKKMETKKPAAKKPAAKKPAAKKPAAKKVATKKPAVKKAAPAKKTVAKKVTKPAVKKAVAKKVTAVKKAVVKKATTAKKTVAKKVTKPAVKKAVAKKPAVKKAAPAKKTVAKKVTKPAVKKAVAKKPAVKKAVAKKVTAVKKAVVKKATVAKKAVVKKATAVKKTVVKKATTAKKAVAKKVTKPAVKKAVAKKPAVKKAAPAKKVTKPAVKKVVAKKPAVKKAAPAKKAVAKKPVVKKVAAKKPVAKKVAAKKPAVKKVGCKKC
jgi:alpha-amylase